MNDRDYQKEPLQVLSFGGGVQSTAMLLMIHEGTLPKPDVVMFADTGSELPETIEHIETNARQFIEDVLQIPFIVCRSHRGSLHGDYMRLQALPMIGVRSCTGNFKIDPQRRAIREIVGRRNGVLMAQCWMGITTDEAERKPKVKDKREPMWVEKIYPLLDLVPTSRDECQALNLKYKWEVIKSGCWCCPYAGSQHWLDLKANHPDLFSIALEMERLKNEKRPGKWGLFKQMPLSMLGTIDVEDSTCDAGSSCFL